MRPPRPDLSEIKYSQKVSLIPPHWGGDPGGVVNPRGVTEETDGSQRFPPDSGCRSGYPSAATARKKKKKKKNSRRRSLSLPREGREKKTGGVLSTAPAPGGGARPLRRPSAVRRPGNSARPGGDRHGSSPRAAWGGERPAGGALPPPPRARAPRPSPRAPPPGSPRPGWRGCTTSCCTRLQDELFLFVRPVNFWGCRLGLHPHETLF